MDEIHEGGCLCGAVRYRVTGRPSRAFVCHCTFCKRASGSAFQIPVFFPKENVAFNDGETRTYEYRSPAHGRTLTMRFCTRCGTHVGLAGQRAPALAVILGGTFDDPDWYRVDLHIFTRHALAWMAFPPDVPCFDGHVVAEDGSRLPPLPARDVPWQRGDPPA